jgi:hypothetical protein
MAAAAPFLIAALAAAQVAGGFMKAADQRGNARVLQENARQAETTGAAEATEIGNKERAASGEMLAQQGGSGIELGSGSALDMLRQNAINREMDIMSTRYNYGRQAAGYRSQAASLKRQATGSILGGFIGAGTTVLTGAQMGAFD